MIGIFDSGLGGLTVVREILTRLKGLKIIYFGDTARTPYGTKSAETVTKYAIENTRFLLKKGAKIIVIACHTASSTAFDTLKNLFPDVPFFEVVTPSMKKALQLTRNKRIGLIATRTTVESRIYDKLFNEVDPQVKLFSQPAPLLVPLIEEGWLKKPETRKIVKKYLIPLKMKNIDTLILGCTHYPIIKKLIQEKAGKRIKLVDPSEEVAISIESYLSQHPNLKDDLTSNGLEIFVSDLTPYFGKIAQMFLGVKVELKKVPLEELML